jgi:hypothetical protein
LITFSLALLMMGCTQVTWEDIQDISPGFAAISDSSSYELVLTKDLDWNTVEYFPVDIHLIFQFQTQVEDYTELGFNKILLDDHASVVDQINIVSLYEIPDTIRIDLTSEDTLYYGLDFSPDSIRPGYSFLFQPYMKLASGETIYSAVGDYPVNPEYVNFCTLPEIPAGIYEAYNKATGFKKDVEIKYMEVYPSVWFWIITDFGLDWSIWDDFWYGTDFMLGCPPAGESRFAFKFAAWGIDLTDVKLEMENDDGVMETRPLRIMPWTYADDSPDIGYYDAGNKQFVFKNIKLRDTWWDIDNHLLEEVTFTYKGK